MALSEKDINIIINDQAIIMRYDGIYRFPGKQILLDEDTIFNPKNTQLKLFAWYDEEEPKSASCFIIEVGAKHIFIDYHSEAVDVYNHYLTNFIEPKDNA